MSIIESGTFAGSVECRERLGTRLKQSRLVKTIRATQVSSVDLGHPENWLSDDEQQSLREVTARNQQEIALRSAGLNPVEISHLMFAKWLHDNQR